jgi:nucleotidyltransferase/DNA polymerase involved in DNA repair
LHTGAPFVYAPRMHSIAAIYDVPETSLTLMRPLVLSLVAGVCDLTQADVDRVLESVEVGEVWCVGPRWAAWLEAPGITTALDLNRADPKAIRSNMTVVGEHLVDELNGRSCLPLELVVPLRRTSWWWRRSAATAPCL